MSVFEQLKAHKNQAVAAVALALLSALGITSIPPTEPAEETRTFTQCFEQQDWECTRPQIDACVEETGQTGAQCRKGFFDHDKLCKGYIDQAIALEAARLRNGVDNLAEEEALIAKFKEECQ